ncbi:hypothetical protein EK21DRAFT_91894 [Setomelanomma holmii]|uniref:Uncharacterized protein n=1 Tax=Setomelanomma holmii TaxID=210430 RepID=A0A9P4H5E9_9PLEO|nr:hypothetical protein EK21DRAFT_91894 [Setomelanomma holmii]
MFVEVLPDAVRKGGKEHFTNAVFAMVTTVALFAPSPSRATADWPVFRIIMSSQGNKSWQQRWPAVHDDGTAFGRLGDSTDIPPSNTAGMNTASATQRSSNLSQHISDANSTRGFTPAPSPETFLGGRYSPHTDHPPSDRSASASNNRRHAQDRQDTPGGGILLPPRATLPRTQASTGSDGENDTEAPTQPPLPSECTTSNVQSTSSSRLRDQPFLPGNNTDHDGGPRQHLAAPDKTLPMHNDIAASTNPPSGQHGATAGDVSSQTDPLPASNDSAGFTLADFQKDWDDFRARYLTKSESLQHTIHEVIKADRRSTPPVTFKKHPFVSQQPSAARFAPNVASEFQNATYPVGVQANNASITDGALHSGGYQVGSHDCPTQAVERGPNSVTGTIVPPISGISCTLYPEDGLWLTIGTESGYLIARLHGANFMKICWDVSPTRLWIDEVDLHPQAQCNTSRFTYGCDR